VKWYHVALVVLVMACAGLSALYVWHPRVVTQTIPFPTPIVNGPTAPDSTLIVKCSQLGRTVVKTRRELQNALSLVATTRDSVSELQETVDSLYAWMDQEQSYAWADTFVAFKAFTRPTSVGTLESKIRVLALGPVAKIGNEIGFVEGDQFVFDNIRKEVAASKRSSFKSGLAVGAGIASAVLITTMLIR
jgi:hypothetical protein